MSQTAGNYFLLSGIFLTLHLHYHLTSSLLMTATFFTEKVAADSAQSFSPPERVWPCLNILDRHWIQYPLRKKSLSSCSACAVTHSWCDSYQWTLIQCVLAGTSVKTSPPLHCCTSRIGTWTPPIFYWHTSLRWDHCHGFFYHWHGADTQLHLSFFMDDRKIGSNFCMPQ